MFQEKKIIKSFLNKRLFFILGFLENDQQNRSAGALIVPVLSNIIIFELTVK